MSEARVSREVKSAVCFGCTASFVGRSAELRAADHARVSGHHVQIVTEVREIWNEGAMAPEVADAVERAIQESR